MKLSCVIPAHNESGCIEKVLSELVLELQEQGIDYEIIVVNDNSSDGTSMLLEEFSHRYSKIKVFHRNKDAGFGKAIQAGIANSSGEAICLVMGDGSDDPKDVVKLFKKLQEGYDVVYGSRFRDGASVYDYPFFKLFVNRLANHLIRFIFSMRDEKDITNAFKIYRREVIEAIQPIESTEFNITLELPIKAELKGFKRASVAVRWYGRQSDISKFSVFRMSKSYIWTLLKLICLTISKYKLQRIER